MKKTAKDQAKRLGLRLVVRGGLANRGRTAATDATDMDGDDDTDPTDPGPMGGAPAQGRGTNVNAIASKSDRKAA